MNKKLCNIKGPDVAFELNSYGISVVGADPAAPGTPLPPFQRFIDRHAIGHETPFVWLAYGSVIRAIFDFAEAPGFPEVGEIEATGWRCMPGDWVERDQVHQLMVGRLRNGLPVTLIPQTANALCLDAQDLRELEFPLVDRQLLALLVKRQRRAGAKPVLVAVARKRKGSWSPFSLTWYGAAHLFVPLNYHTFRWAKQR